MNNVISQTIGLSQLWPLDLWFMETPQTEDDMMTCDELLAQHRLELKSGHIGAARERLPTILADMITEMSEQFEDFRKLRQAAGQIAETAETETVAKLARADLKAATDAMSLIVRTLEKIDVLQRQLARDQELEMERQTDVHGYEEAKIRFHQLIDAKAKERFEKWIMSHDCETCSARETAALKPPDAHASASVEPKI